ncbi:hypothetical protein [Thermocrispum municipale]|jgi:hypothetical protein|uniref:hypothetical protein n=1 Tax=Thermocrispum municipale TaxID=37926 RepID=UPI00041F729B|nr:hypothetical protein [Thermocrispum municipale]
MSWNDYYARRKVMNSVLKLARRAPDAPLPFAEIPRAQELFGTPEQLLLALYYRWNLRLLGKLRSTVGGPEDAMDAPPRGESDNTDLVAQAWRSTFEENPTLRAVLDAHIDVYPDTLIPALEREQRLLAITAGLAEPHEPLDDITRVGASFMALVRHGQERADRSDKTPRQRRRSPVGDLLRLLTPAG